MTIVVGVATPDGLILSADSRTTLGGEGGRTRVASDTSQKVFAVWDRFGVACYGAAMISEKTIGGQMDEFIASLDPEPMSVHDLVKKLGAFFQDRLLAMMADAGVEWDPSKGWMLGFLVAGYDSAGVGHLVDVRVPGDGGATIIKSEVRTNNIGLAPRGQEDVINRLIGGVDATALAQSGVSIPEEVQSALADLEYHLLLPLTLQDAIDCAVFLIRTTIDMQRFSDGTRVQPGGVPGCGGAIKVLAVTRSGADWVSRPALTATTQPGAAEAAIG